MDLSTISDADIAAEHNRREALRRQASIARRYKERLRYTRLVVDKIHEIDKTIPIIIYDQYKHANWLFKRSDGDPRFDRIVSPHEYGYMRRFNLCQNGDREALIPVLAEKFVNLIWLGDREFGRMPNKKDNFYFICKFDIGEHMRLDGDLSIVGYTTFAYERRSNLIKSDA